jgi:flagellar hook-associated protein 1
MSTFSSLEIGKRALIAQKFGLDVTSNNIANVNTTGYSRRSTTISETTPQKTSSGYVGTGAIADNLRTFREEYFDKEIRKNLSLQSGYSTDQTIIDKAESILAEPTDSGIGEVFQDFVNSFEDIANNPQDLGLREVALEKAKTLVERLNTTADSLDETRKDVYQDLGLNVDKVNNLLQQAASLNKNVALSNAQTDTGSQTYVDDRENVLEELAKLTGATVTQESNGQVNAYINGVNVLTGENYSKIQLQETVNPVSGERTAVLSKTDLDGNNPITLAPTSSEMASQLKGYNSLLDPQDSSAEFSIYSKLNDFTDAIVKNVNAITVSGFGLDDTGTTSPGRTFFEPTTGSATASNISINSEILTSSRNIPISSAAGEAGNNDIALKIARLSTDSNFIEKQNPTEYYSNLLGKVGTLATEALNGKNTIDVVAEQLESQRQAVIGVDTDEEAVNLIKFQKAFEAASKVVNVTNELLSTIINLGS